MRVEIDGTTVRVPPQQQLIVEDDLGGHIPKIEDGPWPAFPADLTSIALTVATQAFGTVLIFEKMFESRLFFVDKLVGMGARIILCDPHRAVVTGPAQLLGQRMESPDIRAGMAMLLAGLSAEGQSTIGAAHQIDKGYERIDERLRSLGARSSASTRWPRRARSDAGRTAPSHIAAAGSTTSKPSASVARCAPPSPRNGRRRAVSPGSRPDPPEPPPRTSMCGAAIGPHARRTLRSTTRRRTAHWGGSRTGPLST